jgi:4-hydroxy-tetrahydrodipicolinate synthase
MFELRKGVLPILPTPFNGDESIDFPAYRKLIDFAVATKVSAVGVPAYGSECYKLTEAERTRILDTVMGEAAGRVPVAAQCNHVSTRIAAELASDAQKRGAQIINTAIPRAFAASQNDVFGYCKTICESVDLPVIIQDWNPGGITIGLDFVKRLHAACPNFKYIKFEEPGNGELMEAIHRETGGNVKILSGWGGSYMMELIPAGLHGIVPGLSMVDYFSRIWDMAETGNFEKAQGLFAAISPLLQFSLRNFEIFHHVEKRILLRRGLIDSDKVRSVTIAFDAFQDRHLNSLINDLFKRLDIQSA